MEDQEYLIRLFKQYDAEYFLLENEPSIMG